jgi:hypothetical protein
LTQPPTTPTDLSKDYIHDEFQKRDWFTSGLIDEVKSLHPTKDHINSFAGERVKAVFEENCNNYFPLVIYLPLLVN